VCKIKDQQEKSPDMIKKFTRVLIKALGFVVFLSSMVMIIGAWVYFFTSDEILLVSTMAVTVIFGALATLGLLPFMWTRIKEKRAKASNKST